MTTFGTQLLCHRTGSFSLIFKMYMSPHPHFSIPEVGMECVFNKIWKSVSNQLGPMGSVLFITLFTEEKMDAWGGSMSEDVASEGQSQGPS